MTDKPVAAQAINIVVELREARDHELKRLTRRQLQSIIDKETARQTQRRTTSDGYWRRS